MKYWLVNGAAPTGSVSGEDCISFNPSNIEVSYVGGNWKIVEGSHWILDFGQNKAEAYEAYDIIMKYGFSEICYVGRPGPSMTYFKKTGMAPIGPITPIGPIVPIGPIGPIGPITPPVIPIPMPPADQDCISHNVDNLTVTFINGSFKIVDGSHSLLDFGLNVMDAKRALDIIKYYRMDSHCFVGRPNAPFEYWLAAGAAPSGDMGGRTVFRSIPTPSRSSMCRAAGRSSTAVTGCLTSTRTRATPRRPTISSSTTDLQKSATWADPTRSSST